MLNNSAQETELIMLVRSTNIAALVGIVLLCCGWMMKQSIDSCMLLMMKLIPMGTPIAKL